MNTSFSLELFPPKTDAGMEKLKDCVGQLLPFGPQYISVTYGAGGSTQERTFATVDWLLSQGIETTPHLSCIGADREDTLEILEGYKARGIRRIVALRGDLPSGAGAGLSGELEYASDLVTLIREHFGGHFKIKVAAYPEMHPQAENADLDLEHFCTKVRAGASEAITQYFYNADGYFDFVERVRARGIEIPIVPGIMPITNYSQLSRFSNACGAELPRWLRKRLETYGDDLPSLRAFGLDVVTRLCERLLAGGAPGLHFYSMNQAGPVADLLQGLGHGPA